MKKITIVCPPNGRFSPHGASAVMLNVRDATRFSRFREGITVIGPQVETPFDDVRFVSVPPTTNHETYAKQVVVEINRIDPDLVELRQHLRTAEKIARQLGDRATLLFRHNTVKRPGNAVMRAYRGHRLKPFGHITFVSQFAQRHFVDIHPTMSSRSSVCWNGLDTARYLPAPGAREKLVAFAGRVIPNKGVVEFAEGVRAALARHPDWQVAVAGVPDPGFESYGQAVEAALAPLGARATYLGYRPFEDVMALFQRAAIVVVPSRWDETFGRTALEAMANGAALISSGRGGLKEVSDAHAIYLDQVDAPAIAGAVDRLITDPDLRHRLQTEGRQRAESVFDIRRTVGVIDDRRESLFP